MEKSQNGLFDWISFCKLDSSESGTIDISCVLLLIFLPVETAATSIKQAATAIIGLTNFLIVPFFIASAFSFFLIMSFSSILIFNNVSAIFSSTIPGISISFKKIFSSLFFISFSPFILVIIIIFCKFLFPPSESCLNRIWRKLQNFRNFINMITFTIKES